MYDKSTEMRYLTDNRDSQNPYELVIRLGENGDWYVATVPQGQGTIGKAAIIVFNRVHNSKPL